MTTLHPTFKNNKTEKELKNLYEKYCFLNHMNECPLSDKKVQKYLESKYGYVFVEDSEAGQVFQKMAEKRKSLVPDPKSLDGKNTLAIFISCCYDITGQENDYEFIEDFREKFLNFCKEYRQPTDDVRPEEIAE